MLVSCIRSRPETESERIVNEWIGRKIIFSGVTYQCSFGGKDTTAEICADLFGSEYKVLLYADSSGCTMCKLLLFEWKQLIREANEQFGGKLRFLFFFHPKDKSELQSILHLNDMKYPVFIDYADTLNILNRFPDKEVYQCFLLGSDNKVLSLGNPALNPKIWDIYKATITSKKNVNSQDKLTRAIVDRTFHDFGEINSKETAYTVFKMSNTGSNMLIIDNVLSSCGCTISEWERRPVDQGKDTEIKIGIKPDKEGYFSKNARIYCNTPDSPIILSITGVASK
jgi:hypothetical protein